MIDNPKVLIVIPTLVYDVEFLTKCLASIKAYTSSENLHIQLVLTRKDDDQKVQDVINGLGLEDSCSLVQVSSVPLALTDILDHTSSDAVILLHDDTELLPQEKDKWIDTLLDPFHTHPRIIATGPHKIEDPSSRYDYLDSFCVAFCVDRWRESGQKFNSKLDRYYVRDWCDAVQANNSRIDSVSPSDTSHGMVVGLFPIYHAGGHTFNHLPGQPERDCQEKLYMQLFLDSRIRTFASTLKDRPKILFQKPAGRTSQHRLHSVVATISTKDRVKSTLPLAIFSIAQQTVVPGLLAVFYDSTTPFDFNDEPYASIFSVLASKGCRIVIYQGQCKGQAVNHQIALELFVDYDYVWRIDDDNVADSTTLANLYRQIVNDSQIAAVASLVHSPTETPPTDPGLCSTRIEDVATHLNVQWTIPRGQSPIQTEHLYSTFVYRRQHAISVGGYPTNLSPVGHREETIFTNKLFKAGFQLVVLPHVGTWHLSANHGGIRSPEFKSDMWMHDEVVFKNYMDASGQRLFTDIRVITLDNGVGDHLAFVQAWPSIYESHLRKNPTTKIVIGACYPDAILARKDSLFGIDPDHITIVSIAEAHDILARKKVYVDNVYGWMEHMQWKKDLVSAYKAMYE